MRALTWKSLLPMMALALLLPVDPQRAQVVAYSLIAHFLPSPEAAWLSKAPLARASLLESCSQPNRCAKCCLREEIMILITGATGYIGRHLLVRLVAQGERPRCL